MKSKRNLASLLALCGAALVLAGCGGGNDYSGNSGDGNASGGNTSVSIPSSATVSDDSFIAYMKVLVGSTDDTGNPVSLGDATAPGSDTASPVGL